MGPAYDAMSPVMQEAAGESLTASTGAPASRSVGYSTYPKESGALSSPDAVTPILLWCAIPSAVVKILFVNPIYTEQSKN